MIKAIRKLWCKHNKPVCEVFIPHGYYTYKGKFGSRNSHGRWRYKIVLLQECSYCGKELDKHNVRYNLTENQMKQYMARLKTHHE